MGGASFDTRRRFFFQKTNFNLEEKSIGPKLQNVRTQREWGMASSTCTQNPRSDKLPKSSFIEKEQKREQRRTRPRRRPVVNISEGRSCAGRHCVALQEARHLGILRFVNGRVRRKSSEHKRHSRTTITWQPEAADAQGEIYARTHKKTTAAVCVSSQEAVCRSRGIKWCHAEPPSST